MVLEGGWSAGLQLMHRPVYHGGPEVELVGRLQRRGALHGGQGPIEGTQGRRGEGLLSLIHHWGLEELEINSSSYYVR